MKCKTCNRNALDGCETCGPCYRKQHGIQEEPRDTQRVKVYRMEHRIFPRAYKEYVTVVEALAILKDLSRRFYVREPRLENLAARASRRGDYWIGRIRVQGFYNDRVNKGVILHEFAHHLDACYRAEGDSVPHGAPFVRCLYEVMHRYGYADDRPSRARWKVKIGSQGDFWKAVGKARLKKRGK